MLIDVKDITLEKLNFNTQDLQPGDVVKLSMPEDKYDYETVRRTFDTIQELLPDGVQLIFILGMDLGK